MENEASLGIDQAAERIGEIATRAMLFEVAVTPKPGMVDRNGCGCHMDMDYFSFMQSAAVLAPAFSVFAKIGLMWNKSNDLSKMLPVLRKAGIPYEKRMLQATGGVNTHKGLLFLLGILSAAAGVSYSLHGDCGAKNIARCTRGICRGLITQDLGCCHAPVSHGEKAYSEAGLLGIRGELEQGLPAIFKHGLPAFRSAITAGSEINKAAIDTLLRIICVLEDTVLWHRGGLEGMRLAREEAGEVLAMGGWGTLEGETRLQLMAERFEERGLSPGGAADMLAGVIANYYWGNGLA